jgi:ribosome-binding factor A
MVDTPRARKLAVHIRQIVAETLERQVKDPRLAGSLSMVTVTDARVTPDLHQATVYYTVYGGDAGEAALALESAKGLVRAAVGRRTGVKFTPTLVFVRDGIPEQTSHLEGLLEAARAADADLAAVREGAAPAGDADPYRQPATRDEE